MRARAAGGVGVGLAMSVLTRLMLKFIHRRGHKAPEQLTLTIAMAYLTYYFGQLAGRASCLEECTGARSTLLCAACSRHCFLAPPPTQTLASRTLALSPWRWEFQACALLQCLQTNNLGCLAVQACGV